MEESVETLIDAKRQRNREKFFVYVYLLNLSIPFVFLFLLPLERAIVGALLLLLFALVYLLTVHKSRRLTFIGMCVESLIMLVMIRYLNVGYTWMIFYPAAAIGLYYRTVKQIALALGVLYLVILANVFMISLSQPLGTGDWGIIISALIASSAASFGTMWQTRTYRQHQQLQDANLKLERLTKLAERDRISQDLHDVMGHELSMITLKAQLVVKLIERNPEKAKEEARDIELAARKALTRVREYIANIRQSRVEDEWFDAKKLLEAAGISCETSMQLQGVSLTPAVEQALAMCLREATTNIVRHSGATRALLRCWVQDGSVNLLVADNGRGFKSLQDEARSQSGNGLNGIRARMAAVEGSAYFWSNDVCSSDSAPRISAYVSSGMGTVVHLCARLTSDNRFTDKVEVRMS